ncbi:MAG: hypothetical protein N2321_06130 [Melioribacteraceae bacterium]|nr:hypothetical protein [Melioribacteraceae bacterium]
MKSLSNLMIFLLIGAIECFSQIHPGAKQISIAHSDVSFSNDPFSIFNNSALISKSKEREIGFFYSPSPFGEKAMSNAFAAYIEPTSLGNFSVGYSIYGFELYKETQFAFGYGRKLSNNFSVGGSFIYKNINIKNYGTKGNIFFNIGSIANINEQIGFGFYIENITHSTISKDKDQVPTVFWGGLHYQPVKDFIFTSSLRKELNYNVSLRFGAEYSLIDFVKLRFGIQNEPNIFNGGVGIFYNFVQFDYAISSHQDLGLTHQFSLIFRLPK